MEMASDSFGKEIGDGRSEAPVRAEPSRINDRRRGNRLGFLSFYVVLRLFGRRGAYGLLGLVTCYYLLFYSLARRLARPYLRHRFPDHSG